ncbi:MAG TPA: hypothetical protein VKE69_04805, partial [Planctomycetota bacterium]|nr:hypothetical protein [Planctomycetota bacterium]
MIRARVIVAATPQEKKEPGAPPRRAARSWIWRPRGPIPRPSEDRAGLERHAGVADANPHGLGTDVADDR